MRGKACYAEHGKLAIHWRKVSAGGRGTDWDAHLKQLSELPEGQLVRLNQAGDLPGIGDEIDEQRINELTRHVGHVRAYGYTHKPVDQGPYASRNRDCIKRINQGGKTCINLSANDLAHADTLLDTECGPVVVLLPSTVEGRQPSLRTPAGRRVVVCPATYRDDITCSTCEICSHTDRDYVIGFPAHGAGRKHGDVIAQGQGKSILSQEQGEALGIQQGTPSEVEGVCCLV